MGIFRFEPPSARMGLSPSISKREREEAIILIILSFHLSFGVIIIVITNHDITIEIRIHLF
jgi:ABC-type Mn2+/Zn2+ transport system permease subunit